MAVVDVVVVVVEVAVVVVEIVVVVVVEVAVVVEGEEWRLVAVGTGGRSWPFECSHKSACCLQNVSVLCSKETEMLWWLKWSRSD